MSHAAIMKSLKDHVLEDSKGFCYPLIARAPLHLRVAPVPQLLTYLHPHSI